MSVFLPGSDGWLLAIVCAAEGDGELYAVPEGHGFDPATELTRATRSLGMNALLKERMG
jgi:hypothetical protein